MELADKRQRGSVFMCTFPMFEKYEVVKDEVTAVCMFKGDVELESAFTDT